jgi:hypothetical protein
MGRVGHIPLFVCWSRGSYLTIRAIAGVARPLEVARHKILLGLQQRLWLNMLLYYGSFTTIVDETDEESYVS